MTEGRRSPEVDDYLHSPRTWTEEISALRPVTRLEGDPTLRQAFEGLTPGRQREYNLYVSGAKKAATRATRVERCAGKILSGKGLRDG